MLTKREPTLPKTTMLPHVKNSSVTWNPKSLITKPESLPPPNLEKIPLVLLLKLKKKSELPPRILNTTNLPMPKKINLDNNNTPPGNKKMLNTNNKLKLLMKPQKSFNTYKPVSLLPKLKLDLKKSKLN